MLAAIAAVMMPGAALAMDPTPTAALCAPSPVLGCAPAGRSILKLTDNADPAKTKAALEVGEGIRRSQRLQRPDRRGCNPTPDLSVPPKDLDSSLAGSETTVKRYGSCANGTAVELWTINGGTHLPTITPAFDHDVIDFFFAHSKQ